MSTARKWLLRVASVLAILLALCACSWAVQAMADRACAKHGAHAKRVDRSYICVTPDGRVVDW